MEIYPAICRLRTAVFESHVDVMLKIAIAANGELDLEGLIEIDCVRSNSVIVPGSPARASSLYGCLILLRELG